MNVQKERDNNNSFNILFLVPGIVLVQQNINRLIKYDIPVDRVGAYFGERKEIREITMRTKIYDRRCCQI